MNGNPVFLWLKLTPTSRSNQGHVGKLNFVRMQAEDASAKGLRLTLEPIVNPEFLSQYSQLHWVGLNAEIWNQKIEARKFGRVSIDANSQAPALASQAPQVDWIWYLLPEDLDGIERSRSDALKSPLHFKMIVHATVQADQGVYMVAGEGTFEIPLSEWEGFLAALGYGLPPSVTQFVGAASLDHPSWREAEKRLEIARRHLRAGETYAALQACLKQFEAIRTGPYDAASWRDQFTAPIQKEQGLIAAIAGHCTYLNKVGHHRARNERNEAGDLIEMPVDHWEAELAVTASHLWLAYVLRCGLPRKS